MTRHKDPDIRLPEVLVEMRPVGAYVKVSAIDPITNTEVCIVGDPKRTKEDLKQIAKAKLLYVLRKRAAKAGNSL